VPDPRRAAGPALLAWVLAGLLVLPSHGDGQDWTSASFSRQLQDESGAEVSVRYASGTLRVAPTASGQLYSVRLRFDASQQRPLHDRTEGRILLGVEGTGNRGLFRRGSQDGEMELALSTRIPLELSLDLGAVRSQIDLGGMRLTRLTLQTGASDGELRVSAPNPEEMDRVTIRAGAASFRAFDLGRLNAREIDLEAGVGHFRMELTELRRPETRVQVKMGMGSLEIRVPPEVGVRLERKSFLTSLTAPGLARRGDAYYSANWETAEIRVILAVDAALGSVTIRSTEP
jgi:hypothetical protein